MQGLRTQGSPALAMEQSGGNVVVVVEVVVVATIDVVEELGRVQTTSVDEVEDDVDVEDVDVVGTPQLLLGVGFWAALH